jgi:aldose 1-epimerase
MEHPILKSENYRLFGTAKNGREIHLNTISNKNGMELSVCDFGATITALKVPLNNHEKIDVVLGFDDGESYEQSFLNNSSPFFGAAVGLHAGRINEGKININGQKIQLDSNFGKHHLHGGKINLSNQIWTLIDVENGENPSLSYEITTPAKQSNYPGSATVKVTYQLLENNSLKIIFTATTTADNPINLTQHSYFNLNGHQHSVENLKLKINAKQYLETNTDLIPTGKKLSITDTPFDYTAFKPCPTSIDTSFVLDQHEAAILYNENNQLCMHVSTNQPSVHIYVGGQCDENLKCKEDAHYHQLSGICFETQNFPDAPNHPEFPNSILRQGETYLQETIFQFKNNCEHK